MIINFKKFENFLGLSEDHLTHFDKNYKVHKDILDDLNSFQSRLRKHNIELTPVSTFRSFERQMKIWNEKATGKRMLLDQNSQPLDVSKLSEEELLWSILKWSALPGLSRHHWGTELDVIDQNAIDSNYKVQLIPEEYDQGPFQKLNLCLNETLKQSAFYRPYEIDVGGVAREPWHISHKSTSDLYLKSIDENVFIELLNSEIYQGTELIDSIKKHSDLIFRKFFLNLS